MTLLAGTARVEDTTVAALRDGMIYPKALGRTRVMMDFSGLKDFVTVEVIDTITAGPVSLAGGEFRSWSLPNGRYEIWFTPPGAANTRPITYSILNANCARGLEGPGQYHCVTYGTGAVVVRNVLEPGPRADRKGRVTIIRRGW